MGDNTETREHFDGFLGGRTYDFLAGTTGYGRAYYRRAAQSLPVEAGMTLIDLGCGTGSLTMAMARKLGHSGRITGIDLADKQLSHARHKQLQTDLPIEFVKGSVAHLPFADASVDGISISQVLHALPPDIRQGMISEACRVLKPGGFFGIIEWSRPRFGYSALIWGLSLLKYRNTPNWMGTFPEEFMPAGFELVSDQYLDSLNRCQLLRKSVSG